MALPAAYLTSFKNVEAILAAVRAAQAPPRFTLRFLVDLGFPNSNDRLIITMLKSLGFLTETGVPTKRYHAYLDQTQSGRVMAEAIREAYADLFQVNVNAQDMTPTEVKNKMKTLSEGQFTERVLTQMSGTFKTLCRGADFKAEPSPAVHRDAPTPPNPNGEVRERLVREKPGERLGGLVYNINIHLPESRDQSVYDALFRSLREHLLD